MLYQIHARRMNPLNCLANLWFFSLYLFIRFKLYPSRLYSPIKILYSKENNTSPFIAHCIRIFLNRNLINTNFSIHFNYNRKIWVVVENLQVFNKYLRAAYTLRILQYNLIKRNFFRYIWKKRWFEEYFLSRWYWWEFLFLIFRAGFI